jgi:hypothetical protein|uniref:Uncharacterized protein n=1 Tax=Eutreptiella gymnastica TaxID=73025 RepID=A0A7S4FZ87_9EUGL|mmetsp:Transcript_39871/g.66317  ORF Transcript_39871/g.66317 Transcript_39871/m.66317 type:complete len:146 (-) Transcript_39871:84-521(-)
MPLWSILAAEDMSSGDSSDLLSLGVIPFVVMRTVDREHSFRTRQPLPCGIPASQTTPQMQRPVPQESTGAAMPFDGMTGIAGAAPLPTQTAWEEWRRTGQPLQPWEHPRMRPLCPPAQSLRLGDYGFLGVPTSWTHMFSIPVIDC